MTVENQLNDYKKQVELLEQESDDIQFQIDIARAKSVSSGEEIDPEWLVRADYARKKKRREVHWLQKEIKRLKKEQSTAKQQQELTDAKSVKNIKYRAFALALADIGNLAEKDPSFIEKTKNIVKEAFSFGDTLR